VGLRRLRMKLVRWLRGEGEFVHASVGEQSFIRNAGRVNCLHFKRVRAAARAACANLIVWDGRQRRIAYRWGENKIDRVPELAADLVRRKVAVMLATGNTAVALTAKAATATIPILFISGEQYESAAPMSRRTP
jgi:hypothetical protein